MDSETFRKKVKIRLIQLGWSQKDLADKLGISHVYVNMLLRGARNNAEQKRRIKDLLHIED